MLTDSSPCKTPVTYTVYELNQMVACLLTDCFPLLKVVGEISNFVCPRSGHWYFSLKDTQAQVRCVFFQGQQRASQLNITDGMEVVVHARLRLYEVRGDFQLVIEEIEPVGDGALRQKYDALKKKLAQEGLFDAQRKKSLPAFIDKIGIITSPTGAAIRDILAVLNRRFPYVQVIIYPTLVQGAEAGEQIAKQIKKANYRKECQVLLITRGGGSLEDLWPFNEEIVARAISDSHIPTVSAVGHEIDVTISDFVADIRAATPSAAAELVSPDQAILRAQLLELKLRLTHTINAYIENYKKRIIYLKRCLRHPGQRLQNYWQQVDDLDRRLLKAIQLYINNHRQNLMHLSRALESVNPLSTLLRGYSLSKRKSDGKVLHTVEEVKVGEEVITQLATGQLICKVTDTSLT
jgi:exodeoxyribonuclease VII large subunit